MLALFPVLVFAWQPIVTYSRSPRAFFREVWEHFVDSTESPLTQWKFEFTHIERAAVLSREENYPFVLTHFCNGSVRLSDIPNAVGITGICPVCNKYTDGCPVGDPGFADASRIRVGGRVDAHFMLGSGLNCMAPSRCVNPLWLSQLEQLFVSNSRHVTKAELFVPDACNMPYVERNAEGKVLLYMSYRFGLYIDFLVENGELNARRVDSDNTVLEIGAGWGGFAGLVKAMLPLTRYIIVDIPTSLPLQMSYAYHLGHTKIYSVRHNATSEDVEALVCCTNFDFLFLMPHQLALLPADSVRLTVNFDSMVEMPDVSIRYYLKQIHRISKVFFAVNRVGKFNGWPVFRAAVNEFVLHANESSWSLISENSQLVKHPQRGGGMAAHVMMDGRHSQLLLAKL